jgi:hypothetical protein
LALTTDYYWAGQQEAWKESLLAVLMVPLMPPLLDAMLWEKKTLVVLSAQASAKTSPILSVFAVFAVLEREVSLP